MTLDIPTKPRNCKEEKLLEKIVIDPSLKSIPLRRNVLGYLNHGNGYALVAWYHRSVSNVKYSFENEQTAIDTRSSYNGSKPTPYIVGIKTASDLDYM